MNKIIPLTIVLFLICFVSIAQNEIDALRYSQAYFGGTARSTSMAGSFNALGADISTLNANPAGIGLYRGSEFTITPSLMFNRIESSYFENSEYDNKAKISFQNIGIVWASTYGNDKLIRATQFGISYNKLADFNNRMFVEGYNSNSSITDMYVEMANGYSWESIENDQNSYFAFDLNPAWMTYFIDTIENLPTSYFSYVGNGGVLQRQMTHTSGGIKELAFSFGSNMSDKLYAGLSIGIPIVDYQEVSSYYELVEGGLINESAGLIDLQVHDSLRTEGSGVNVKFGMIYNPVKFLRIGAAIHSPTWYSLQDSWKREFMSNWTTEPTNPYQETPTGYYDYKLETPWRAIGSLGFIIAKNALINIDYEFVDYVNAVLRADDYNFISENDAINNNFNYTNNIRIGAEYRIGIAAFRGGYANYGSPYKGNINDGSSQFFTGGLGFRTQNFYMDLAYIRSVKKENLFLYTLNNQVVNPVINTIFSNNFIMTMGFKF